MPWDKKRGQPDAAGKGRASHHVAHPNGRADGQGGSHGPVGAAAPGGGSVSPAKEKSSHSPRAGSSPSARGRGGDGAGDGRGGGSGEGWRDASAERRWLEAAHRLDAAVAEGPALGQGSVCLSICPSIDLSIFIYISLYMYVCIYICIFYIYI